MKETTKYYVVKEKAVPEVLLKVVEAKKLMETRKAATIQEAVDMTGANGNVRLILFSLAAKCKLI